MRESVDLLAFLTLGLLGGFGHCVGMCAPFVLLVSRRFVPPGAGRGEALRAQLWYTAGRVVTYGLLGALAGFVGGVVELAGSLLGLQRAASVAAGVVLVLGALAGLAGTGAGWDGGSLFVRLSGALGRRLPGHPLGLGLFLGLLPCGLLYSALIAAVARGGVMPGALALLVFGVGTAPALLGLSLADELLARRRALLDRLSLLFVLAMGLWFVWSGLGGQA